MADDIIDAHEQSEQARKWLQQNGSSIVVGILLGLAVLLGWQRWQQSGVDHRAEALAKFEELQAAVDKEDTELAGKHLDDLRSNYEDTPHAALAALEQAEGLVKAGKLADAEALIRFAVDKGVPETVQSVARLRLARLLIARAEPQRALDALREIKIEGFTAEIENLRGDAFLALDKRAEALKAYEAALAATDVGSGQRKPLEVKRDDLAAGGAPAVAQAVPQATAAPAPGTTTPPMMLEPQPAATAEKPTEQGS